MLVAPYPNSLNLQSNAQKMNTQPTASVRTENTIDPMAIDENAITKNTAAPSLSLPTVKQATTTGIPMQRMSPQNTRKLVIRLEMYSRGKNSQMIPMVVLAASMQDSPVTDITITELLFRICRRSSMADRQTASRHRNTDRQQFLLYLDPLFAAERAIATTLMRVAANTNEPKELPIHLKAVSKALLSLIPQYQKEQNTAMMQVIKQQRRKVQKKQVRNQMTRKTISTVLDSFLSFFCDRVMKIMKTEQNQKAVMMTVGIRVRKGVRKTAGFSEMNLDATLIRMIPAWILLLKQNRTQQQSSIIIPAAIVRPMSSMTIPMMAMARSRARVRMMIKQTMNLVKVLTRKMQVKLTTSDITMQPSI